MSRLLNRETMTKVGMRVTVCGWVNARRNMSKIVFLDLRDRSGILQAVLVPSELNDTMQKLVDDIRLEYCLQLTGTMKARDAKQINPNLETGSVELLVHEAEILNPSKTPVFELEDTSNVNEEVRLKYRYLDLRSPRMRKNLRLRDRVTNFFRDYLHARDFLEVETPYLTKGTPEGAREFLVPSRLHAGQFYVLPQSPQQFKQLCMVAGIERYFQMARCFRDEDQRGDRQPEHTQLDMELSFVEREDVLQLVEQMFIELVQTCTPEKRIQQIPFPRLTYQEAMKTYGTDRPDLREDRNDPNLLAFCWVIDFPFFERDDAGGWTFSHNPFSAPLSEHMEWLLKKEHIGEILTTQYDIVLNGYEIGGGSIRNHRPEALKKVFEILGYTDDVIQSQFGHMLEALTYGAPPHGGIAPGVDRIVMLLAGEPNIREVMAFPKTGDARDPLMGAPSEIDQKRLDEVHIALAKSVRARRA